MKKIVFNIVLMLISMALPGQDINKANYRRNSLTSGQSNDNLIWADEFNVDGPLDSTKWFHQTLLPTTNSWYNGEIQHYTDRIDNSNVEDGVLKIVAKKETYTDQGVTKTYTSARLNSKFAFTYGRAEIRAKLPSGVGTWPALWMLGKNINERGAYWYTQGYGEVNWPACGEIDIMEHWGTNQNFVQSAMHTPSSYGGTVNKGGQTIPTASTEFHVYAMDWTPEKIVFSVDDKVHYTYNPAIKNADTWPFDKDQYLLMNIAIQSSIDENFTESAMEIDYVRIYDNGYVSVPEEKSLEKIRFYPNPVKDNLTLSLPPNTGAEVLNIYSMEGKLVKSYHEVSGKNEIVLNDLSDLDEGLYLFRIMGKERTHDLKLAKVN
jgi:beta-glucanase (GH16 family)